MNQDSKQVASTHQQQILGCMNLNTGAQLENFFNQKSPNCIGNHTTA